jgi:hypothetical protein
MDRRGIVSDSKNSSLVTQLIWVFSVILVGLILLYSRQQKAQTAEKASSVNTEATPVAPVAPRAQRRAGSPHDLTGDKPPAPPRKLAKGEAAPPEEHEE